MELLCPNCQKRVTVPDQYAGQVMKCPLCGNTFTTPSLAPAAGPAFMPPVSAPPPTGPSDFASPADAEPFASLSPSPARSEAPVLRSAAPEPIPGDYRHRLSIWISPRVLPWIAVASLVIVFVLTFFPWDGFYPGGIGVMTQNAWQAAFGGGTHDKDLEKIPPLSNAKGEDLIRPAANVLLIIYLLLFLVVLVVSCMAAALGVLRMPLGGAVERLKPWRWLIASGLISLAFLFLLLQLLSGFSLVNSIRERARTIGAERSNAMPADNPTAKKGMEIETAEEVHAARYTCSFWSSFWLTLLALICAVLTYLLSRRPRPVPKMELLW